MHLTSSISTQTTPSPIGNSEWLYCDCNEAYYETPEYLQYAFDPISLQFRNKVINKAKQCLDKKSILQILSKFDLPALYAILETVLKQTMFDEKPRKMYYRIESITEIFGEDIVQYIASFVHSREINQINKSFKKYTIKNEKLRMYQWIQNKVGSKQFVSNIYQTKLEYVALHHQDKQIRNKMKALSKATKYLEDRSSNVEYKIRDISKRLHEFYQLQPSTLNINETDRLFAPQLAIKCNKEVNDIWFVDNDYYGSDDEDDKPPTLPVTDWRGPFENVSDVLTKCKNGDKIYIKGTYRFESFDFDTSVEIIGIEKCCIWSWGSDQFETLTVNNKTSVHFKNITFKSCNKGRETAFFRVKNGGKLFLSDCRMEIQTVGIECDINSSFYVKNCFFVGRNKEFGSMAIKANVCSKDIFITNCQFFHFGNLNESQEGDMVNPCIKITDDNDRMSWYHQSMQSSTDINFECVGNIFENNYDFPICVDLNNISENDFVTNKQIKIYDNTLKGFNGLHVSDIVNHANCVWIQHDETDGYEQFAKCKECNNRNRGQSDSDDGIFYCWDCWEDEEDEDEEDEDDEQVQSLSDDVMDKTHHENN